VKVALVTTPPSIRSGIGDYTRHLLPYLREHCDVRCFVEHGHDEEAWGDTDVAPVADLNPRDYDQVLYQLGNESAHSFMPHMIRAIGGTVMQHDWVLFDMAMKAFPALFRGGAKGHMMALREGGVQQASTYARNWIDRRNQRTSPIPAVTDTSLPGILLGGWYAPEDAGRWVSDFATLRLPSRTVKRVEIELHADPGRQVRIHEGGKLLSEGGAGEHVVVPSSDRPLLVIETTNIRITKIQREHGDVRRMGSFVYKIRYEDEAGVHELDMRQKPAVPNAPVSLSRDRFQLPLNRSVVRFADSFIVHSRYVGDLIQAERNSSTPMGILHHGSEFRWHDEDRKTTRRKLGLDEDWANSFMVVSFGGVQPHKRIDKAIMGLAEARKQRDDVRLVLAGSLQSDGFDPVATARSLGLEDAVHFTGFLPEEEAWLWLHAGNFSLNLRGPSSGGTSGGIFQSFSVGRPVIATDACEQAELPNSCVVKVPLEGSEVSTLARTFVELRDDEARRTSLEAATREFVEKECHWGIVAKQYADYMEGFPRPRCSRKNVISMRLATRRSAL